MFDYTRGVASDLLNALRLVGYTIEGNVEVEYRNTHGHWSCFDVVHCFAFVLVFLSV